MTVNMSAHRQVPSHFKEESVANIVSHHFPSSLAFASADCASSGLLSKRDRLVKLYLHLHDNKKCTNHKGHVREIVKFSLK